MQCRATVGLSDFVNQTSDFPAPKKEGKKKKWMPLPLKASHLTFLFHGWDIITILK
jgi:hypothetical protein